MFQIRPQETPLTLLLFAHCFCVVGALSMGRSLRDALFLAHYPRSALPWMYILSAVSVASASTVYARYADKVRKDAMAGGTGLVLAALLLAVRVAMVWAGTWVYSALYVVVEVMAAVSIIQFWNLANEMFNPREAKRLFGFVGAGGTLATIVLGSLISAIAKKVGTPFLLFPCAALLALTFPLTRLIHARSVGRLARRPSRGSLKGSSGLVKIISSGHLRLVAVLGMATFVTTTLVDYQFKSIAQERFSQDQLTAFFGMFYAVCGGLSMFIQLGGTSRILSRFGVVFALSLLPIGLASGTGFLLVVPTALWAATWAKGADNVLRYTINDATTQLLYLPVPAQIRGAAKAAIDGILKPSSIAIAGAVLLGYHGLHLGDRPVTVVTLGLIVAWMLGLARMRNEYIRSLQDTLRQRHLVVDGSRGIGDGATVEVLARALRSPNTREVLNALELLPHLPQLPIDELIPELLFHGDAAVRRAVLEHVARYPSFQYGNDVFRRFEDPDPTVRAAAVEAFCAIGRERSARSVRMFLRDPDPAIRSAAVVGMIRYGGLEGVLAAAEALKSLIADPDPQMREHAARVLGEIGVKNFYQPVLELMADPVLEVRVAAIQAAGRLRCLELAPALVYRLARADTASHAVLALAEYGDPVVPILDRVLANRVEDLSIRRNVPRVLSAIHSQAALELLQKHLDEIDEGVRSNVAQALRRTVHKNPSLVVNRERLLASIRQELVESFRALAWSEALGLAGPPGSDTPHAGPEAARALLFSALQERIEACEARVFALLAELYPEAGIDFVYAGIRDATARDAARLRANAVELLDNVLDRELQRAFIPLLEDTSREAKLRAVAEIFPQPPRTPEGTLLEVLQDSGAWVRACACFLAREQKADLALAAVEKALEANWPVLREMALSALGTLCPPERVPSLLERAVHDDSKLVRERAEQMRAAPVAAAS